MASSSSGYSLSPNKKLFTHPSLTQTRRENLIKCSVFCERNGCAAFTYNKQTGVCTISDCPATVGDPGVNTKTFECKMHYFDIKQKKMGGQRAIVYYLL